jgi:hypothetical protein
MHAEAYMIEMVDPTINDFEANPGSRRHAFLACLATFHSIDYLAYPGKSANLRDRFRRENTDFAVIDRVAHAFKHVESGDPNSPQNQPLDVSTVFARPAALAGVMQSGISRCGDTIGGVEIWGERVVDLLHIVRNAAAFLRTKISSTS